MLDPVPAPRVVRVDPTPDPIAQARALMATAVGLGARLRVTQHQQVVTQRKAGLYINALVKQVARLLQGTRAHGVPLLRANEGEPGRRVAHYVIRSEVLDGPPVATRLLVVGSDGKLRVCVIGAEGGSRIWADYDVTTAPEDLTQRAVIETLSRLIGRLERTVTDLEIRQITREAELEADITMAKARIAGMTDAPTVALGTRAPAVSEEPVRPWTRHGSTAARLMAERTAPAATGEPVAAPAASLATSTAPVAAPADAEAATPLDVFPTATNVPPTRSVESASDAPVSPSEPTGPHTAGADMEPLASEDDARAMRRRLLLTRLGRAI
ncbi:MAG: hypothetical protein MUD17_08180 [Gemmatimonadaceae bacterium]|jgi:hypothetical protein|nr:hypothetical protein [Gemmatimonadaceae bacterium]